MARAEQHDARAEPRGPRQVVRNGFLYWSANSWKMGRSKQSREERPNPWSAGGMA